MNDNLKKIGKDYKWLIQQLDKFNIKPADALIVTYDRRRKNFLSSKGKVR